MGLLPEESPRECHSVSSWIWWLSRIRPVDGQYCSTESQVRHCYSGSKVVRTVPGRLQRVRFQWLPEIGLPRSSSAGHWWFCLDLFVKDGRLIRAIKSPEQSFAFRDDISIHNHGFSLPLWVEFILQRGQCRCYEMAKESTGNSRFIVFIGGKAKIMSTFRQDRRIGLFFPF